MTLYIYGCTFICFLSYRPPDDLVKPTLYENIPGNTCTSQMCAAPPPPPRKPSWRKRYSFLSYFTYLVSVGIWRKNLYYKGKNNKTTCILWSTLYVKVLFINYMLLDIKRLRVGKYISYINVFLLKFLNTMWI